MIAKSLNSTSEKYYYIVYENGKPKTLVHHTVNLNNFENDFHVLCILNFHLNVACSHDIKQ